MEKHELIGLTIERLLAHFENSPESFDYVDSVRNPNRSSQPTITWKPKVQLKDYMGTVLEDPNNCAAVIVTFNEHLNDMTCYIFLKAPAVLDGAKADSVMNCRQLFQKWRSNYRKFKRLRNLIIARDIQKENMFYLKKLSTVFPDTMDKHLL